MECCTNHVHKTGIYFNDTTISLNGIVKFYCQKPNCHNEPCVNFRVGKKVRRYSNAFGDSKVYHIDNLDTDVGLVLKTLKTQLDKVIVFDCFDHSEALVAEPKNCWILDGCREVMYYNKELNDVIRRHMITKNSGWIKGHRIRVTKNLILRSPIHRMPTVNRRFVWNNVNISDDESGTQIVYRLPCDTLFQLSIDDFGKHYYDLNYPQMLLYDVDRVILRNVYHFDDKMFLRYSDCEGCDGSRCDDGVD